MLEISYNGEFGYELVLVIPYCYFLSLNKIPFIIKTSKLTKCLYYFTDNHHEIFEKRISINPTNIPNIKLHVKNLDYTKWIPPPYNQFYKNNLFVYDKPLLIIHNKYTSEWNGPPVNFINISTLQFIFSNYCNRYQIVYIRPNNSHIINDSQDTCEFNDTKLIKENSNVIDFNNEYEKYKDKYNYNELQLMLHANSNMFISVQGGTCILSSFFGGHNIILASKGGEVVCDSFHGWMEKLGNSSIIHVMTNDELRDKVVSIL